MNDSLVSALPLILASRSPRRKELLTQYGYQFTILPPSDPAECGLCSGESPPEFVARLAYQKAADVVPRATHGIVVGCDTVAEVHGQILGKPADEADARRMLTLLRGREHTVYSGLCVWRVEDGKRLVRADRTVLRMDRISEQQLDDYLASEQWEGKAGAFGYQDGPEWLQVIEGSETNVVGLPMELLQAMLIELTQDS